MGSGPHSLEDRLAQGGRKSAEHPTLEVRSSGRWRSTRMGFSGALPPIPSTAPKLSGYAAYPMPETAETGFESVVRPSHATVVAAGWSKIAVEAGSGPTVQPGRSNRVYGGHSMG